MPKMENALDVLSKNLQMQYKFDLDNVNGDVEVMKVQMRGVEL